MFLKSRCRDFHGGTSFSLHRHFVRIAHDIGNQKVAGTGRLHCADEWKFFFSLSFAFAFIIRCVYPAFRLYCFHFNDEEEEVRKMWIENTALCSHHIRTRYWIRAKMQKITHEIHSDGSEELKGIFEIQLPESVFANFARLFSVRISVDGVRSVLILVHCPKQSYQEYPNNFLCT